MLAVSLFLCGLRKLMLRSCGVQLSCVDAPTCCSSCASDLASCLLWLARRVATVIRSVVDHVVCASRVPLVTHPACWCSCARHGTFFSCRHDILFALPRGNPITSRSASSRSAQPSACGPQVVVQTVTGVCERRAQCGRLKPAPKQSLLSCSMQQFYLCTADTRC